MHALEYYNHIFEKYLRFSILAFHYQENKHSNKKQADNSPWYSQDEKLLLGNWLQMIM